MPVLSAHIKKRDPIAVARELLKAEKENKPHTVRFEDEDDGFLELSPRELPAALPSDGPPWRSVAVFW